MKFILFISAIFLLIFTACSNPQQLVPEHSNKLPNWYINPPLTSQTTIYTTGEGKTKKLALENALNTMASTLSTSISSSFKSKITEYISNTKSSYNSTTSNEIQSNVKKLNIINYEILNSQEYSFRRYIVLIKADKKIIFNALKNDLNKKFFSYDEGKKNITNLNIFKKLKFYEKVKYSLSDLDTTLTYMYALDKNFIADGYIKKALQIEKKYQKLLSNISFSINSNNQATNLKSPIQKALNDKNFIINSKNNKNHFNIYIKADIQKVVSYGFTLARTAISIKVIDFNGNEIASNKLNITGQSTQGYKIAKQNIAKKFQKIIENDGIEKVLGINF